MMIVLTARERIVCERISDGFANKEIAFLLGLTENTVKNYVSDLLQNLPLRNRVEIARWVFFYPSVLVGNACELLLHLPGCACGHPRCVYMLGIKMGLPRPVVQGVLLPAA
jgi:DNA-binding CsgD family transcriptional regulator